MVYLEAGATKKYMYVVLFIYVTLGVGKDRKEILN